MIYDRESYNTLVANGIDDRLAKHVAHLFIRDPLVVNNYNARGKSTRFTDILFLPVRVMNVPCVVCSSAIPFILMPHTRQIYEEKVDLDDKQSSDHFENIQSTNWQTVRFKPPPPNSPIGWRVEFRTMEVVTSVPRVVCFA